VAVTLHSIAQAANVSVSTASRALNNSPLISLETRKLVARIADELGYRPHRAASALRSRRSHLIGLVLNNLVNQSFHTIAEVVQRKLAGEGYQLILATTDADPAAEESLLLTLADHGVEGILVIGSGQTASTTNRFLESGIAIVNTIRSSPESLAPTVLAGDRDGAFEATEHLVRLGHRRIGFIGGMASSDSGRERFGGYVDALGRHGIAVDEALVERGPFTQEYGARAIENLVARGTGMTALFAANHEAVFGIMPWLVAHNIAIPSDLSLVCFEDMPLLQMWRPPVSVVDNGALQIAELSVDLLLGQIRAHEGVAPNAEQLARLARTYRVGAQFVPRESTAVAATAGSTSRKAQS
jgi:LacI family transcriptional regulator